MHPQCILGTFTPVTRAVHLWSNHSGWMLIPGLNGAEELCALALRIRRLVVNELIQDSEEIFSRSPCRRQRESLPCLVLLCQAAAMHRADGGIARSQMTGNPRERAKKREIKTDTERMKQKRETEKQRGRISEEMYLCNAILTLYLIMNHEGPHWHSCLPISSSR